MPEIPFNIFVLFISLSIVIFLVGLIMGLRRIAGAPFICIFASIMIMGQIAITQDISGVGLTGNQTQFITQNTTNYMNQNSGGTILVLSNTLIMKGEFVVSESSMLNNKVINQLTVRLDRDNSPTGWLYAGVWSGIPNPTLANSQFIIGQKYSNSTSSTPQDYTFTRNDTKTYRLQSGDVVGLFYNGGSASPNIINIVYDGTADKFDGANSYIRSFNSATQTWSDVNPNDFRMKVSLVGDTAKQIDTPYQFDENDTWVYTAFLSLLFAFVGIMLQVRDWGK